MNLLQRKGRSPILAVWRTMPRESIDAVNRSGFAQLQPSFVLMMVVGVSYLAELFYIHPTSGVSIDVEIGSLPY